MKDDNELENEDVPPVREFCELIAENSPSPPPRFSLDNTNGVNLQFYNDTYFDFFRQQKC